MPGTGEGRDRAVQWELARTNYLFPAPFPAGPQFICFRALPVLGATRLTRSQRRRLRTAISVTGWLPG